jgi:hypothetical protein
MSTIFPLAGFLCLANHRLEGGRGDVVIRVRNDETGEKIADVEGIANALFVEAPLVSSHMRTGYIIQPRFPHSAPSLPQRQPRQLLAMKRSLIE